MESEDQVSEQYKFVLQAARERFLSFQCATNPIYEPNWHHRVIATELEKIEKSGDSEYKIIIVTVPPRHGKSEECTIGFPAWYLGRNPTKEIITVSYSAELSLDFGSKTRSLVASEMYQQVFPGVTLKEDEKAKAKWRTNKGGSYTSVGVGGAITGRGANVLIIDDPIKNREEAESDVIRDKVWDFFTSTAYTRLEPGGVVFIILTRWHVDDIAGRILADPRLGPRTKLIKFPAIATEDEPPYRKAGEALWKGRWDKEVLMETKNIIGPYDWQALYQCSPVLSENQEFKPEWIRKCSKATVDSYSTRNFLTVDTAISKASQADYTGFCENRVNKENFWHLKAWRVRLGVEELIDTIFTLYKNNHYEAIGIEKTVYLDGLKPYLDMEMRRRGVFLPIVELSHNNTKKEIRVRGLIPRYAARSIFHIEGECTALEEEMWSFPNSMHDDVIDATAYQLQLADNPNIAFAGGGVARVHIPD
jgi:hypothetical protein